MKTTRTLLALPLAVALVGLSAGAASAGEFTGNGTAKTVKGTSICAFSGQNDGFHDPSLADGPEDAATRVQSFGQLARHGLPAEFRGFPGLACNPNGPFAE